MEGFIRPEDIHHYLSMDECVDKGLYIIKARNSDIGIYDKEKKAFIIRRKKFSSIFLYPEDHWDTGEDHGTVKPLKFIRTVSNRILNNEKDLLRFLKKIRHVYREAIKKEIGGYYVY